MRSRKFQFCVLSTIVSSFALLSLTACTPTAPPDNRAGIEQTIRSLDAQWSKTAGAHDLDGTVSFYSNNALLLGPDEPLAADNARVAS